MKTTVERGDVEVTILPATFDLEHGTYRYIATNVRNAGDDPISVEFSTEMPDDITLLAVNDDTAPAPQEVDVLDYSIDINGGSQWRGDFVLQYNGTTEKTVSETLYVTIDGRTQFVDLEAHCIPPTDDDVEDESGDETFFN